MYLEWKTNVKGSSQRKGHGREQVLGEYKGIIEEPGKL
jgi:hypothetical protein